MAGKKKQEIKYGPLMEAIMERYSDEQFLQADGLEAALLGVDEKMRLIYSVKKCIAILMERDKIDYSEAVEFFGFNILGAYVGEKTPIRCEGDFHIDVDN